MVMTSYPLNSSVPVFTVTFEYPSKGLFLSMPNCSRKVGSKTRGGPKGVRWADSNNTSELRGGG